MVVEDSLWKSLERMSRLVQPSADTLGVLLDLSLKLQGARNRSARVWLVGNGGSAAMASHVAVDLTKNAGIRASTFNDFDLITCFANDFGHDNWMAKALEKYANQSDLLIAISSSGESTNVVNVVQYARVVGIETVTLTGMNIDNPVKNANTLGLNIHVPSAVYNEVECAHQWFLLAVVDQIASAEA